MFGVLRVRCGDEPNSTLQQKGRAREESIDRTFLGFLWQFPSFGLPISSPRPMEPPWLRIPGQGSGIV